MRLTARWAKPVQAPRVADRRWSYLWHHMLAAYPCQEPGGDRLWDVSGRGNHGTFGGGTTSPTRMADGNGRYLRFAAASSQLVTLPVILGSRLGWTVAALYRFTDSASIMTLWSEVNTTSGALKNEQLIGLNRSNTNTFTNGRVDHHFYNAAGTAGGMSPSGARLMNDGKWHLHVAACGSDSNMEAACDGSATIQDTNTTNVGTPAPNAAAIGCQPFGAPLEFGSFDLGWLVFLDTYMPMSLCSQLWSDPFGWLRAA